jgi:DNA repair protein RecO (recombination protein O)
MIRRRIMLKTFNGIVLKSDDYSDSDKILTVFSKQEGKIPIIFKRAKQIKKSGTAVSQLFSVSEFVCYVGADFYIHNSSVVLKSFTGVQNSIQKLASAAYIAQMLNYSYENYQKDERAYNLITYCMSKADKSDNDTCVKYIALFQTKLLAVLGYAPVLDACAVCGSKEKLCSFDNMAGGMICEKCSKERGEYNHISREETDILFYLLNIQLNKENLEKINLNNAVNLIKLLHYCLSDKIGKNISTYDFLISVL